MDEFLDSVCGLNGITVVAWDGMGWSLRTNAFLGGPEFWDI